MPENDPTKMTLDQAVAIISEACEIASETERERMTLDEKVRMASARNIVLGVFEIGRAELQRRGQNQAKAPATTSSKPDESLPGEDVRDTLMRRAKEEAKKQNDQSPADEADGEQEEKAA